MFPYAQTVKAGDFVFTAGLVSPDVDKPAPFGEFPVRHQARGIYTALERMLAEHGTSLENSLSVLQFFRGRGQTAAYINERKKFFPNGVPTSTGIACTSLVAPDATVQIDGIIAMPTANKQVRRHGGTHDRAAFSNALTYGDWIFCSGMTSSATPSLAAYPGGLGTAIPEEAQVDPNYWFGIPVQPQTRYIMEKKIGPILQELAIGFENLAFAHVHLENAREHLPGFIEIWNELFAGRPPLTVVSPSNGLGGIGPIIEITPIAIFPGGNTVVRDVELQGVASFCGIGPLARRIGDLVFTSTLVAADDNGLLAHLRPATHGPNLFDQSELEMRFILDRLQGICAAEGGSIKDVVKLRVYVGSMRLLPAAYRALHDRLEGRTAISIVENAGNPDWVPGCTLSVDAVAYLPG